MPFHLLLQGIPSCPVDLTSIRSRLPDIGCWRNFPQTIFDYNEKNSGDLGGIQSNKTTSDTLTGGKSTETPLQQFYKQHRKMPGFRGRRGLCGCFQVSLTLVL